MMHLTRVATKEVLLFFDFHRPHHPLGPDHTFLGPAPGCRAQGAEEARAEVERRVSQGTVQDGGLTGNGRSTSHLSHVFGEVT